MKAENYEQGSPEWLQARCGSIGASEIYNVMAKTRSGYGAGRKNLMAKVITEKLTGAPTETYINDAMRWGTEKEPEARDMYELVTGNQVTQVGLIRHPTIEGTHFSPDGLIDDGLIEIKCPNTATHIETILSEKIDDKYIKQMQWGMAITDRGFCDFVSFDPRLPGELMLFIKRVDRDDKLISEMEEETRKFLDELNETMKKLEEKING